MEKTLILYKTDKENGVGLFPNRTSPVQIHSFKYSANRMGNAPTISATVEYPACLDNDWSDSVYTIFRGEKYYLKQTPSSSFDNTTFLYKHTVEFVSERIVLETVYFFDVVTDDTENDRPSSNSTRFSFYGDLSQFAKRLEYSIKWAGLDYSVVVDMDVELEEKELSFEDAFLYDAIKDACEIYGVPFYFIGKTIHIGYAHNLISDVLKYGVDDALMSISKNNKGCAIVNRITGIGSDRNIPYYYPNPTPKGTLGLDGPSKSYYNIVDQMAFCNKIDLERPFHYNVGIVDLVSNDQPAPVFSNYSMLNSFSIKNSENYVEYDISTHFTAEGAGTGTTDECPIYIVVKNNNNNIDFTQYFIEGTLVADDMGEWPVRLALNSGDRDIVMHVRTDTTGGISYYKRWFTLKLRFGVSGGLFSSDDDVAMYINMESFWGNQSDVTTTTMFSEKFIVRTYFEVSRISPGAIYIKNLFQHLGEPETSLKDAFIIGKVLYDGEVVNNAGIIDQHGGISCGRLDSGIYTLESYYIPYEGYNPNNLTVNSTAIPTGVWIYDDTEDYVKFEDAGLVTIDGYTPGNGDRLFQVSVKRVNVQNKLMPSVYRETDGEEYFYNAEDGKYTDERGEYISFKNPYATTRPREHIYVDEGIYPTITGVQNSLGLDINVFTEFAFDDNDNDELYPAGAENENKYIHPYFFGKLRKFDGEYGFNLFDSAIEGQPMTISMRTGKCGGCNFTIGVDEETNSFNPVQVDEFGNLKRDDDGNVVRVGAPQPEQNDTRYNTVWVALKKEEETFGVIMPNASKDYRPAAGDEFVILNIKLPEAYILAAEDELERACIDYMKENNEDTYDFSVKFSSIFFETAPNIQEALSENSRVKIQYDGIEYTKYVSSYSYSMSDNQALPEITIETTDEIKAPTNAIKNIITNFDHTIKAYDTNIKVQIISSQDKADKALTISSHATKASDDASVIAQRASVDASNANLRILTLDSSLKSTNESVSGFQYLRKVIKESSDADSTTGSIGSLLSVKNSDTGNTTCGLYGGGVSALDDIGLKDSTHGSLVVFAGANNIQGASESNFRVYEDGTLYAGHGVFGGLLKRSHTEVTPNNISTYIIRTAMQEPYVDLTKVGSFVTFKDFVDIDSWIQTTNATTITLPYYMESANLLLGNTSLDNMLALVGNTIIVRFDNVDASTLCFDMPFIGDDGVVYHTCAVGNIYILTCVAKRDTNKKLNIAWKSL